MALLTLAVLTLAVLMGGCAPIDESSDDPEVVDSAQEELIVPTDVVLADDDMDDDAFDDVRDERETTDQGWTGPEDLRAEPVPHPWVPKQKNNDNDT